MEETHYYPFGLTMAGISSKSAGSLENKKKYNGIEWDNDLDLAVYDAFFRELDPQTGRWWQIDPKIENMEAWSPYASNFDNPVSFSDPLGDEPEDDGFWSKVKQVASNAVDHANGAFTALLDNQSLGIISLRKANGQSANNKAAFNHGQDVGDVLSMVVGVTESIVGEGIAAGGLVAAPFSRGVSLSATAVGTGLMAHGAVTTISGLSNLIRQKDRVEVNGNSKASVKDQTIYGLAKKGSDKIEKVGISSGKLDKNGIPYRANKQVKKFGKDKYEARVLDYQPAGKNARAKGLELEKKHTNANKSTINPNIHKRPKP